MRKKRVCIIRYFYYPSELNIKREAEALLEANFNVCVICARKKDESLYENINGVSVYRIPIEHKRGDLIRYIYEYLYFFIKVVFFVTKLYFRERFSVIQVNTMPDFLIFSTLIPKLFGTKIVLHIHEPMPELWRVKFGYNFFIDKLLRTVRKWAMMYADYILTVTQQLKETLTAQKILSNKITVILNVPDENIFLPHINEINEKKAYIHNEFAIITHGAIEDRYGLETAIRAISTLKDKIPNMKYYILGEGSYKTALQKIVANLNNKNYIRFTGYLPFQEMVDYLRKSDLGIIPMEKNPYSELVHTNKMFEYMMLKKSIIASRLKAVESYFPNEAIMYFEPGNPQDLAEKILYLYNHPEKRKELVKNASKIYEKYQWSKMKMEYIKVYEELLSGKR